MTGIEAGLAAGAVALVALSQGGGGSLPNGATGVVPAGSNLTVNISGYAPFLTLSTSSQSLAALFESAIQAAGAGYQVTSWNVTGNTLTSALLDNQVPYSGSFTIVTTVDFGQGSDLINSIAGYLYQVTGYMPTVNIGGTGIAGQTNTAPSTTLNLGGLTGLLNSLASGSSALVWVAIIGVLAIVWLNQKEVVRRVA